MQRDQALKILSEHQEVLHSRYGIATISVFGSVARNEAGKASDVDILVTFEESPGMFGFLKLKEYLEKILASRVDLVTRKALKKQLSERILKEAIRAA